MHVWFLVGFLLRHGGVGFWDGGIWEALVVWLSYLPLDIFVGGWFFGCILVYVLLSFLVVEMWMLGMASGVSKGLHSSILFASIIEGNL